MFLALKLFKKTKTIEPFLGMAIALLALAVLGLGRRWLLARVGEKFD